MLALTILPARQGDAIWIRWGDGNSPRQFIIDMGTEEIGRKIRERIEALPEDRRKFELLVISHVDRDHIGGVLTCLAEAAPIDGVEFKDIWFNGWVHLDGGRLHPSDQLADDMEEEFRLESFGPAQGERLSHWLRDQTWNKAFGGDPVFRKEGQAPNKIELMDGLSLTILGPTAERLRDFKPKWKDEVQAALKKGSLREVSAGLEAYGSKKPPKLNSKTDLKHLAETRTGTDDSEANGSSISLLLEYKGINIVLSGDAFDSDLVAAFKTLSPSHLLEVDAFKLPHHASKNNITKELIESVKCQKWLISTDGTQFRHPDAIAIARILHYTNAPKPLLAFNVPSTYNQWWDRPEWKSEFNYDTLFGDEVKGLTLLFDQ